MGVECNIGDSGVIDTIGAFRYVCWNFQLWKAPLDDGSLFHWQQTGEASVSEYIVGVKHFVCTLGVAIYNYCNTREVLCGL